MYEYEADVIRVVDGDTLVLTIDLGLSTARTEVCRLAGINCPEKHTDAGRAARDAVEDWVARHGSKVTVRTVKPKEKYGRYLAEVMAMSGESLVADLIAGGHALRWTGRGARP